MDKEVEETETEPQDLVGDYDDDDDDGGDDEKIVDGANVRADLLFATNPLLPQLASAGYGGVPPVAIEHLRQAGLDSLLRRFVGEGEPRTSIDLRLRSELQIFIRSAFSYPQFFTDGRLTALSARLNLREVDLNAVFAAVLRARERLDRPEGELLFYDDLSGEHRSEVEAQLNRLAPREDDSVLLAANLEASCGDDLGFGRDALINLAFGDVKPLDSTKDLTEPELWPTIFPAAWLSVRRVGAWQTESFLNPAITGRSTTVVEHVALPPPLDEAVRLDVARLQHRASLSGEVVVHRALVYSLAAPHGALTDDAGILYQAVLGDDDALADAPWYGLVLKRLGYRSAANSGLTQLVCSRWLRMIKMAIG